LKLTAERGASRQVKVVVLIIKEVLLLMYQTLAVAFIQATGFCGSKNRNDCQHEGFAACKDRPHAGVFSKTLSKFVNIPVANFPAFLITLPNRTPVQLVMPSAAVFVVSED
jgi:hypothetical protein